MILKFTDKIEEYRKKIGDLESKKAVIQEKIDEFEAMIYDLELKKKLQDYASIEKILAEKNMTFDDLLKTIN